MQYAVALYFNNDTESQILQFIRSIVDIGANTYMLDNSIPPHMTISLFSAEDQAVVVKPYMSFIRQVLCFDVHFSSIDVFYPNVIYLAPKKTEYMMQINQDFTDLLIRNEIMINAYYLPQQWVPHVALGVQLNQSEMTMAYNAINNDFIPFSGRIDRIALAKCNPYKEIDCFNLQ